MHSPAFVCAPSLRGPERTREHSRFQMAAHLHYCTLGEAGMLSTGDRILSELSKLPMVFFKGKCNVKVSTNTVK